MSRKSNRKQRALQAVGQAVVTRMASSPSGAPYLPDGSWNYGFYDAVNYSTNRAARPYFATDSQFTLTAWSRLRALSLSRWAYINVHFVKAAVDLMARLTVGNGFTPKSHCADPALGASWDAYYLAQTRRIGFMDGASIDELCLHDCRSSDVDGDLGYVMTEDELGNAKLQLIEGHRIITGDVTDPNCRDGVWLDQYGRQVAFNVRLPGEDTKTRRIGVRDFIYIAEKNRPDENRSMTNLIHALAPLQDLYEVLGFAMQSAKKNTEVAAVIKTNTPHDLPGLGPNFDQILRDAMAGAAAPGASQSAPSNGQLPVPQQSVTYEQVYGGGGKVAVLRPDEEFNSYSHQHPSPTIKEWAEFIIRGIAAGYGVPFEVLWNPEKIGGANTRLITALLRSRLQQRRAAMIFPKLTRVRLWVLARGTKRGEVKYHPDIFKVEWNPNFLDITVDSGRESRERRANVLAGLDTFTGYFAENGQAYEDQIKVREREMALQFEAAKRLKAQFPDLSFEQILTRIAMLSQNASELGSNLRSSETQ